VAALEDADRGVYGVQFHPEVAHTRRGQEILKHFLYDVCGCRPSWTMVSIIEEAVGQIRAQVGDEKVICGLSGGVDSAVAAALVQGTLYPDIIESGTKDAAKIKSHHNVGGLPDDLQFELVEPLRNLFKDEVRVMGEELGLPEEIVWRQPFPGPGLAVRIVGTITPERLEILRRADAI